MSTEAMPRASDLSLAVASEIRAQMGRQSMSRSELGRRLGMDDTWVGKRLNGRTEITVGDLNRIAAALDIDVVELFAEVKTRARRSNKDVSLRRRVGPTRPTTRPVVGRPPNRPAYELMPAGQRRPSKVRP